MSATPITDAAISGQGLLHERLIDCAKRLETDRAQLHKLAHDLANWRIENAYTDLDMLRDEARRVLVRVSSNPEAMPPSSGGRKE